ncbi:type VI secretion system tip protein VgrG [Candidatus Methylospira mobilis]|uniref:Type VI secretion system tip protein VgrG n=1 Tax=Candidatus Methylospira mobilis TaxID=1808979 RepID=A0A5Q0BN29_9GAMM|nr:type VI secretion system tip protein TssI/VgrG [Candidatus Methylospira mobilis]QFY44552.1 type VI secretion system tip protein VgrG [Candidatus Methylospira mobilis]
MSDSNQLSGLDRRFTFGSEGDNHIQFEVVRFEGEEALSTLYRFELLLAVANNGDVDETLIIGSPALFTLSDGVHGGKAARYHGLVQDFSYAYQVTGWTFYRAVLVPKMWRLTTYHLSEVYINKNRTEIFRLIAERAGLIPDDFESRLLQQPLEPWVDYVCQFKESYFDFIARWAERLGDYWWYEENDGHEKIVFSNSRMAHLDEALPLHYQPSDSSVASGQIRRRLQSLECETRCLPRQLTVMDYNHERAALDIKATVDVDARGIGEVFVYGENLKNNEHAANIARLRAEAIHCRSRQYTGSSTATGLRCGHFVEVKEHPRKNFNRGYLLTWVKHSGSQAGMLLEGLSLPDPVRKPGKSVGEDFYRAEFGAILSDVQFRPEIRHPWPKIEGTLTAFIDAEGSGEYAELNEKGEYKVKMPFAVTDKGANKSSAWIRKSSQYAGSGHGMHFPLHKGTEVLLSFINGDPDRPVILMALQNSISHNVVNKDNQFNSRILTAAGQELTFCDKKNETNMLLKSSDNCWIHIGQKSPFYTGSRSTDDNSSYGSSGTGGQMQAAAYRLNYRMEGMQLGAYRIGVQPPGRQMYQSLKPEVVAPDGAEYTTPSDNDNPPYLPPNVVYPAPNDTSETDSISVSAGSADKVLAGHNSSYVYGNNYSNTLGDSYSYVQGKTIKTSVGVQKTTNWGNVNTKTYGMNSAFSVEKNDCALFTESSYLQKLEFIIGTKQELSLALVFKFNFGIVFEIKNMKMDRVKVGFKTGLVSLSQDEVSIVKKGISVMQDEVAAVEYGNIQVKQANAVIEMNQTLMQEFAVKAEKGDCSVAVRDAIIESAQANIVKANSTINNAKVTCSSTTQIFMPPG